jgi:hypothetical protein
MPQRCAIVALSAFGLLLLVGCDGIQADNTPTQPRVETDAASAQPAAAVGSAQGEDSASSEDETAAMAIAFSDLDLSIKPNIVFREEMLTDRVKELFGQRIRIEGVMYPAAGGKDIKEFVLLEFIPNKFGPGSEADTLVIVKLREGEATSYPGDEELVVSGVLRLDPFEGPDGNTWSIYDLEDATVRTKK